MLQISISVFSMNFYFVNSQTNISITVVNRFVRALFTIVLFIILDDRYASAVQFEMFDLKTLT